MVYITVMQPPMYHQMSLEEFLFQTEKTPTILNPNLTNTRTYELREVSQHFKDKIRFSPAQLILKLIQFNEQTEELRSRPRHELYREFHIPKKSGGLRKIDAPNQELMDALRRLKTIFEEDFKTLYHTSAFAYIKNRCTLDAVKRHQANESKWFGKFDLSNFFGSTTPDFVMQMFSMIYPFSEIVKVDVGKEELAKALELAFLDGGLPQGTPISPLITNVMMIPIDYKLANALRDFNDQRFIYTRYADDFIISSRFDFSVRDIEKLISDTLESFGAPFKIKAEKTRYGSNAGRNWNLGLMLGKDNRITVGYRKKRQFKAMLHSFVMDTLSGKQWPLEDIQTMEGYRNYYRMIEGEMIDDLVNHIGEKLNVNVVKMIKEQLSA